MARSRRRELDVLPRREELEALVHYYYHLRNERKRAAPESSVRRRLEDRMFDVRERFDRLLEEWVPEEELREEWRAHIENRGPAPPGPPAIRPLAFLGVSDASSVVEVRGKDDEFRVEVDGALV